MAIGRLEANFGAPAFQENPMSQPPVYLDHMLECPYCQTIRLRIPVEATPTTSISCSDCGKYLGTWDEIQTDFERQGGNGGVFRLDKGRIERLA